MGHLELTLDDGSTEQIDVPVGESVEERLKYLLERQSDVVGGLWVAVGENRYIRYDRIAAVRMVAD